MRRSKWAAIAGPLLTAVFVSPGLAQNGGAPAATATPTAVPTAEPAAEPPAPPLPKKEEPKPEKVRASCTERIPEGATRPTLEVKFPARGLSGHAAPLTVVVTHGVGETVMPGGVRIDRGSDELVALRESGWAVPDPAGGSAPSVERPEASDENLAATTVTIPFVPLPKEPGRHHMVLPPMPITVARANGAVMTLCTPPQSITVEDPIANEVSPEVRPNPPPRPQREEWVLARQLFYGLLAAIALGVIFAYLIHRYRSRPKPVPAAPKELPWIWAMRELDALRRSDLLAEARLDEWFDRVDHCTRRYLGERYGFDGLESTSEEIRTYLKRVRPVVPELERIDAFLTDTDFIKYAEVDPTGDDCDKAIEAAERIVRVTIPAHAERLEALHQARTRGAKAKKPRGKAA
jgi:hypothetical protein